MTIGSTIKALRRAKNLTQEDLAEYLGISPKAVSQWECERTAPDISMLAPLASIFDVTADRLLGIDINSKRKQIDSLYNEAYATACNGEHGKAIKLTEHALMLHPSSYKLMDFYANEVFLYNHTAPEEEREANQERALHYIDKILNECTDPSIRNNCISMACLWYQKLGRIDEAERLAKTLDGAMWTCGELLGKIYTGRRQFEVIRDEMLRQFASAMGCLLRDLLVTRDDDGNNIYSEDEILQLDQMCINMFKLYFPDGDYYFYAQYIESAYTQMADIYASRNQAEKTIECLSAAVGFAVHFDAIDPNDIHTSPAAKGVICGEIWWNGSHNSCYNLLDKLTDKDNTQYDFIRDTKEYNDLLIRLRDTAK